MKQINFIFRPFLYSLILILLVQSCKKETSNSKEMDKINNSAIVKEFELKSSWFGESKLKSSSLEADLYDNFGVGLDILNGEEKISIFNPNISLAPIVSTPKNEKTDILYVSSSDYSEIDNSVSSALSSSLGISLPAFKLNGNLTVNTSTRITKQTKSVYISVVYVKRYGRATLQYTSTNPNVNGILTYSTNLNTGGSDGITISNSNFRNTFGDKFRSAITFGVALNATIQITNVDFRSESKEEVAAQAQLCVKNMINSNTSWDSQKASNAHFRSSDIIIAGSAIPRCSYIYNRDDLVAQISYLDGIYTNDDLGIICDEYSWFSNLYPTYNFISTTEASNNLALWKAALNKLSSLRLIAVGSSLLTSIDNEISTCNSNITLCQANQAVSSTPGSYSAIEEQVYKSIPTYSIRTKYKLIGGGEILTDDGNLYNGKAPNVNYDPSIFKPLYLSLSAGGFVLNDVVSSQDLSIPLYIFKDKKYNDLIPLYRAEKSGKYDYSNSTSDIRSGFSNVRLLGWVFPN